MALRYAIAHKTWGDFVGKADENIVQHFSRVCWLTSKHSEYIFQRRMLETLSWGQIGFQESC